MKSLIWISTALLLGVLTLHGQQGRGGKPLAWNDKDKDGICDITNKPVGQNPGQGRQFATGQPMGQGRGGAPFAWGDKDKDGICDYTGRPVGQFAGRGRAAVNGGWAGRGRGRGRMMMLNNQAVGRGGWGRRGGRGMGRRLIWQQNQQTQPNQAAPKTQAPAPAAKSAK